jgi:RNA polymerase sigma-32 factor
MEAYVRSIRKIPLLSAQEEQRLAQAYRRSGDTAAAHRLVTANLRFVVAIARQYRVHGARMADLVQEGNIGLMAAVERFDPDKGARLVTYAAWWIRAYVRQFTLRSSSVVKPGSTAVERLRSRAADVSLEALVADGGARLLDLAAGEGPSPHDELSQAQEQAALRRRVADALTNLDDRERFLVDSRLMGEDLMSLREVGDHFGCSPERVHQIQRRLRKKLRDHLQASAASAVAA